MVKQIDIFDQSNGKKARKVEMKMYRKLWERYART